MIDAHRLQVLVAVARCGTLSAAAAELHYSQATISHHLSRLEAETGAVLTQRVGRGLRLTDDGHRLAQRGTEIVALLDRAARELNTSQNLSKSRVRLTVFPSAASTLLPEVLRVMSQRHPGVEVIPAEAEPDEARAALRAGESDVAVIFGYRDELQPAGFRSHALGGDTINLVTPAGGPLAGRTALREHRDSPWIAGCDRCRRELLDLALEESFEPDIRFATDDYVAVQHLVASGFGVALLPELALQAFRHPDIEAVPLPQSRRLLASLTFGAPPYPPVIDALVEALADVRSSHQLVPNDAHSRTGG